MRNPSTDSHPNPHGHRTGESEKSREPGAETAETGANPADSPSRWSEALAGFYRRVLAAGFHVFRLNRGGGNAPFPAPKDLDGIDWDDRPLLGIAEIGDAIRAGENIGIGVLDADADLLILDCDSDSEPQAIRDALRAEDCHTAVVRSPNGVHPYFAGNVPVTSKTEGLFAVHRGGGHRGYVVGPGSWRSRANYEAANARRKTKKQNPCPDDGPGPWYYTVEHNGAVAPVPPKLRAMIESPHAAPTADSEKPGDATDDKTPEDNTDDTDSHDDTGNFETEHPTTWLLSLIGQMIRMGVTPEHVRRAAEHCNSLMRTRHRAVNSLSDAKLDEIITRIEKKEAKKNPGAKREIVLFHEDPIGVISARNRLLAYLPDGFLRFNERESRVEMRPRTGPETWQPIDEFFDTLRRELHERTYSMPRPGNRRKLPAGGYGPPSLRGLARVNTTAEALLSALKAAAFDNRRDPFLDYLEALPKWDRTPRIETLLQRCFTIAPENRLLAGESLRASLLGMVNRARTPAAKFDWCLILIGSQGSGKDSFFASLPPTLPGVNLYSDTFSWDDRYQQQVEACLGKAVVHASEMPGVSRADRQRVNRFITKTDDRCRLSYRRDAQDFPRRFVLVASSNDLRILPIQSVDDGRRWRPVPVEGIASDGTDCRKHILALLDAERDQLFAEACTLATQGLFGELSPGAEARRRELLTDCRARGSLDDAATEVLDAIEANGQHPQGLPLDTLAERMIAAQLREPKIGWTEFLPKVLRAAGWSEHRKSIKGERRRRWQPPERAARDDDPPPF